jgi:alpha-beta hydrolase superfamily lysophospholipase
VLLLGETFGGIQVFKALLDAPARNHTFAGAVSLGGLITIHPNFKPPRSVVAILVQLAKCSPRWKTLAVDFSHSFDDAFGNKEWAKVARADEPHIVVSPRPTLGALSALMTTGDAVMDHASEITIPMLAVHGQRDCRCEIANMEERCSKVKDHKAKLVPVDTDGHQLLQDTDEVTDEVMGYISDFVGSHM